MPLLHLSESDAESVKKSDSCLDSLRLSPPAWVVFVGRYACHDPDPPSTFGAAGGPEVTLWEDRKDGIEALTASVAQIPRTRCRMKAHTGKLDGTQPLRPIEECSTSKVFSKTEARTGTAMKCEGSA